MTAAWRAAVGAFLAVGVTGAIGATESVAASLGQGATGDRMSVQLFRDPAVLPAFSMVDLEGRVISSEQLRGKVTLVNFWATWCPPCRAEIPDLIALQEKYRERLLIIGVSEDEVDINRVRRFVTEHKINFPIVMTTPAVQKVFPGVIALPTMFVLDPDVRIVQRHVGLIGSAMVEAEARVLAGMPVNASIELIDQPRPKGLENAAQAKTIPGVDLTKLTPDQRTAALQKMNAEACTCGCDLTVAKCRVDDPFCGVSLPAAMKIVKEITGHP